MSTLTRTFRNLWRVGLRDAAHQMQYIGDTKAGTFIGADRYGNRYYENLEEELPRMLIALFARLAAYKNDSTNSMGRLQG